MTIPYLCRIGTTWTPTGEFDERAYAAFLERYIECDIGLLLASQIDGYSVSPSETLRIYRAGVSACRGRVTVGASGVEENTAAATIERAKVAVESGLDFVTIYGPAGWHGYRPSDDEYLAFHDHVFSEIKHPSALCPNPVLGYLPAPELIARVVSKHRQVEAIILTGSPGEMYFFDIRDLLAPEVRIYVHWRNSMASLALKPTGLAGTSFLPRTTRRYLDLFEAGQIEEAARSYLDLVRFERAGTPWHMRSMMAMPLKAFKLAGKDGAVRDPYVPVPEADIARYLSAVLSLNIPEVTELATEAGLT